jgi:hypothetical protein
MITEAPKPTPPRTPDLRELQRVPNSSCAIRQETFYTLPWTIRIEIRDLNPADAAVQLTEQYRLAIAQLAAASQSIIASKVAAA